MDCKDVLLSTGRILTRFIPKFLRSIHSVESILRSISKLLPWKHEHLGDGEYIELSKGRIVSNFGDDVFCIGTSGFGFKHILGQWDNNYDRCYPRRHCVVCRNLFAVQITISEGDLVGISFLPGRKYPLFSCACDAQGGAGDLQERPVWGFLPTQFCTWQWYKLSCSVW